MADRTEIAWCDSTFNPWIGCTKVSPGCDHCYAATQDKFRSWTPEGWGGPRKRTGENTWGKPEKWNDHPFFECPDCGQRGDAREMGDAPKACQHLNARPARRRVFCSSLADVFDNQVDPAWRADLFFLIEQTPHLDWLLLTKRIGNVMPLVQEASELLARVHKPLAWPLPNVWLGATVVNQEEADRDIPKLLATPARVKFLSMEPLLGPVDIRFSFSDAGVICCPVCRFSTNRLTHGPCPNDGATLGNDVGVDWVIVGGESGAGARPMHPDWARGLRDQCAAAGVPFLFKQHGEWAPGSGDFGRGRFKTAAIEMTGSIVVPGGLTRDEYPVNATSADGWAMVHRAGKKAAGRLLDGVTHNGFPESAHA